MSTANPTREIWIVPDHKGRAIKTPSKVESKGPDALAIIPLWPKERKADPGI
jgi:hypothetical protein